MTAVEWLDPDNCMDKNGILIQTSSLPENAMLSCMQLFAGFIITPSVS